MNQTTKAIHEAPCKDLCKAGSIDTMKHQLCEANKVIANKDIIINMLQAQINKMKESFKESLSKTEEYRFKYCQAKAKSTLPQCNHNTSKPIPAPIKQPAPPITKEAIEAEYIQNKKENPEMACQIMHQNIEKILKEHHETLKQLITKIGTDSLKNLAKPGESELKQPLIDKLLELNAKIDELFDKEDATCRELQLLKVNLQQVKTNTDCCLGNIKQVNEHVDGGTKSTVQKLSELEGLVQKSLDIQKQLTEIKENINRILFKLNNGRQMPSNELLATRSELTNGSCALNRTSSPTKSPVQNKNEDVSREKLEREEHIRWLNELIEHFNKLNKEINAMPPVHPSKSHPVCRKEDDEVYNYLKQISEEKIRLKDKISCVMSNLQNKISELSVVRPSRERTCIDKCDNAVCEVYKKPRKRSRDDSQSSRSKIPKAIGMTCSEATPKMVQSQISKIVSNVCNDKTCAAYSSRGTSPECGKCISQEQKPALEPVSRTTSPIQKPRKSVTPCGRSCGSNTEPAKTTATSTEKLEGKGPSKKQQKSKCTQFTCGKDLVCWSCHEPSSKHLPMEPRRSEPITTRLIANKASSACSLAICETDQDCGRGSTKQQAKAVKSHESIAANRVSSTIRKQKRSSVCSRDSCGESLECLSCESTSTSNKIDKSNASSRRESVSRAIFAGLEKSYEVICAKSKEGLHGLKDLAGHLRKNDTSEKKVICQPCQEVNRPREQSFVKSSGKLPKVPSRPAETGKSVSKTKSNCSKDSCDKDSDCKSCDSLSSIKSKSTLGEPREIAKCSSFTCKTVGCAVGSANCRPREQSFVKTPALQRIPSKSVESIAMKKSISSTKSTCSKSSGRNLDSRATSCTTVSSRTSKETVANWKEACSTNVYKTGPDCRVCIQSQNTIGRSPSQEIVLSVTKINSKENVKSCGSSKLAKKENKSGSFVCCRSPKSKKPKCVTCSPATCGKTIICEKCNTKEKCKPEPRYVRSRIRIMDPNVQKPPIKSNPSNESIPIQRNKSYTKSQTSQVQVNKTENSCNNTVPCQNSKTSTANIGVQSKSDTQKLSTANFQYHLPCGNRDESCCIQGGQVPHIVKTSTCCNSNNCMSKNVRAKPSQIPQLVRNSLKQHSSQLNAISGKAVSICNSSTCEQQCFMVDYAHQMQADAASSDRSSGSSASRCPQLPEIASQSSALTCEEVEQPSRDCAPCPCADITGDIDSMVCSNEYCYHVQEEKKLSGMEYIDSLERNYNITYSACDDACADKIVVSGEISTDQDDVNIQDIFQAVLTSFRNNLQNDHQSCCIVESPRASQTSSYMPVTGSSSYNNGDLTRSTCSCASESVDVALYSNLEDYKLYLKQQLNIIKNIESEMEELRFDENERK